MIREVAASSTWAAPAAQKGHRRGSIGDLHEDPDHKETERKYQAADLEPAERPHTRSDVRMQRGGQMRPVPQLVAPRRRCDWQRALGLAHRKGNGRSSPHERRGTLARPTLFVAGNASRSAGNALPWIPAPWVCQIQVQCASPRKRVVSQAPQPPSLRSTSAPKLHAKLAMDAQLPPVARKGAPGRPPRAPLHLPSGAQLMRVSGH